MRNANLRNLGVVIFGLLLSMADPAEAGQLEDFRSDGCSLFPDGTPLQKNLWCECCITHDIAYWQGGSRKQKQQADQALRECVEQKTGNAVLADTMYYGVALGGRRFSPPGTAGDMDGGMGEVSSH